MSSELREDGAGAGDRVQGPAPTLQVNDLHVAFGARQGFLRRSSEVNHAVDGVSFALAEGEVLGIVGESGAGKSALLRALVRVRRPTSGTITFQGKDVWSLERNALRQYRQSVTLVFQNALHSFPPGMRVGEILAEPLRVNKLADRRERRLRIGEALEAVGLDSAAAAKLPRQLSGGQRQRVGIARALVLKPKVMILDEPVSALDVSIQAQVLNLFLDLQREYGLTYLIAAHDLAVLKHTCTRIAVMYLGQIVEMGPTERIFANPLHPYTQALLHAVPTISRGLSESPESAGAVGGDLPDAFAHPSGCKFHPRCQAKLRLPDERFKTERPHLVGQGDGHSVACFLYPDTK